MQITSNLHQTPTNLESSFNNLNAVKPLKNGFPNLDYLISIMTNPTMANHTWTIHNGNGHAKAVTVGEDVVRYLITNTQEHGPAKIFYHNGDILDFKFVKGTIKGEACFKKANNEIFWIKKIESVYSDWTLIKA